MNAAKIARLLHELEDIITESTNSEQPVQWADGVKALAALDTIAAEVAKGSRTGRWIPHEPDCRGYTNEFFCTWCKMYSCTPTFQRTCEFEFCPNCGAKMEDESDG